MPSRKLHILCDVDEVCADLLSEWLYRYNIAYGDNILPENIRGWDFKGQLSKACGGKIYDLLREPGFYDAVRPVHGARTGIYKLLADGHRITYVSSCVEGTEVAKRDWLIRWGFLSQSNKLKDFIATGEKHLIRGDVLFDDRVETVEKYPGEAVLVEHWHNLETPTTRNRIRSMFYARSVLTCMGLTRA